MTEAPPRPVLYGYPVSNYVNVVRAALLEKGVDHDFVVRGAAQDGEFLELNPMGKIPAFDTGEGCIAETVAILEYLDDRYSNVSLRPSDLLLRARSRQVVNIVQMYVEAPARSLYAGVFMGGENDPSAVAPARAMLDRATAALRRLVRPSRFLIGDALSSADLFVFYNLDLVDRLGRFLWGRSVVAELDFVEWDSAMRLRASTATVLDDFEGYFANYLADKGAAYRAPAQLGSPIHA